jgi:phosphatidylserine decarboxylase
MVRDGYLYALGLAAVAAVLFLLTRWYLLAAIPLALALFFLWFFRDPERAIPSDAGAIVSPADGVVTAVERIETTSGSRLRLSIFLSVFNVHVNRSPVGGAVKVAELHRGRFLNAMNPQSAVDNEHSLVVIETGGEGGYEVSFRQIAGLLARRIVCNLKPGGRVERGERIGLIKFGSRVDVLMPAEAELMVAKGARVHGGSSVLARMPAAQEAVVR